MFYGHKHKSLKDNTIPRRTRRLRQAISSDKTVRQTSRLNYNALKTSSGNYPGELTVLRKEDKSMKIQGSKESNNTRERGWKDRQVDESMDGWIDRQMSTQMFTPNSKAESIIKGHPSL